MRIFQEASVLSEPHGNEPIDRFTLSYMSGLARDRIHQMILAAFANSGMSKADLAKRLGMDKSRVSRILNTSSNITAETLGAVMFAIDGSCPKVTQHWPLKENQQNFLEPVWLAECIDGLRITSTKRVIAKDNCMERVISTNRPVTLTFTTAASAEAREYA